MTSLVLTERQQASQPPDYTAHVQQLPGGLDVLVAPAGADSASSLDRELGSSSSDIVTFHCDLIADCGRLVPGAVGQEKLVRTADIVLLLVRPDVAGVAHAQWATSRISELSPSAASVVIAGTGVFKPAEVAEELGVNVLGFVPFDPVAARMVCGAPGTTKAFVRSNLVAFARETAQALIERARVIPAPDEGRRHQPPKREDSKRTRRSAERLNWASRVSRPNQSGRDNRTHFAFT